jgi:hypothetical protein
MESFRVYYCSRGIFVGPAIHTLPVPVTTGSFVVRGRFLIAIKILNRKVRIWKLLFPGNSVVSPDWLHFLTTRAYAESMIFFYTRNLPTVGPRSFSSYRYWNPRSPSLRVFRLVRTRRFAVILHSSEGLRIRNRWRLRRSQNKYAL